MTKGKKKIEDSAFLLTLETKGNNFGRGFLRSCNDRAVFFLRAAAVNRAICRLGSLDNLFRVHFKLDFQFGQFNFESNLTKFIAWTVCLLVSFPFIYQAKTKY